MLNSSVSMSCYETNRINSFSEIIFIPNDLAFLFFDDVEFTSLFIRYVSPFATPDLLSYPCFLANSRNLFREPNFNDPVTHIDPTTHVDCLALPRISSE